MLKEICLGCGLAVLGFLLLQGYDMTPLLVLGMLAFFIYFMIEKKGLIKTKTFVQIEQPQKVFTFDDIGGQQVAKQELKEALDFIVHFDKIKEMGIRPLKGILLTGPPGTGKTLLAKAAATYTNSVFLASSGSEFIEMYAGVGAQRVRQLFRSAVEKARKDGKKSAIIFIDEIEVLGGKRGQHTSHLEYDQTLNQLLVEMDGLKVDNDVKVLLIGATNRPDLLDQALMRPGRFDRQVKVDLPDKSARLQILQLHTRNKPLAEDVDLATIAQETFGFSGAHLESVANEAAILAMRENKSKISQSHIKEAVDKVMLGEKIDKKANQEEIKRVAIHETGHAIISEVVRPQSVSHVTITSRGNALGYMRQVPEDDQYLYTKDYLEGQIMICLGGAIAEELFLGNRSTGAAGDFDQAVNLAKRIIVSGLSPLGVISQEYLSKRDFHLTMQGILREQEIKAKKIIEIYKSSFTEIINTLMKNERISGDELREMLKAHPGSIS